MAAFSKKIRKHFSKYSLKKTDTQSTRSSPTKGPKPKPSLGSSLRTAFTGRSAPPNTPASSIYEDSDESDPIPVAPPSTLAAADCEPELYTFPRRPTHMFSRDHTPDSTTPPSDLDSRVAPPEALPRKESKTVPTAPPPGPTRRNTTPAAHPTTTTRWNPPSALKSSIRPGTNTTPAVLTPDCQGLSTASGEAVIDEPLTFGHERVMSQLQEDFAYERGLDLEEPVKKGKEKAKSEKSKKEEAPGLMKKASLFWMALKTKYKVHKAESRALEKKATEQSKLDQAPTATQQPTSNAQVPTVYPLHYNRFVRRTESAHHLKPETPLHKSKQPTTDPVIHSPKPMKSMPSLTEPSHTPPSTNTAHSDPITPASHLHGTKNNCVRHGRKRQSQSQTARSMLMKDRNGTYVPTGLTSRRQMEATSPWAVANEDLGTRSTAMRDDGSEACPDCVAELRIKRRELQYGSIETVKRPTDHDLTEASKDIDDAPPVNRVQTVQTENGAASMSEDEELVTLKDLGPKLNAIVVEHGGDLSRVVLNSRNGQPTMHILQKLSKELAKVSNSIAFAGIDPGSNVATSTTGMDQAAIVLDTSHCVRGSIGSSIPDLLDMIDQAANDIHLNTGKLAEHYTCRRGVPGANNQSLISTDEFDNLMNGPTSPTRGIVGRQNMHEQYRSMHEHLKNAARKDSIRPTAVALPEDAQYLNKINANHQELARLPPDLVTRDNSSSAAPAIIQPRPTMQSVPSKADDITPDASAPSETPSKINTSQLSTQPTTNGPSAVTPKLVDPTRNHSPFLSWLNPFHHHKSETPSAITPGPSQPSTPSNTTPTPSPSVFHGAPNATRPDPADLETLNLPIPDITKHPNPYHHAPSVPSRMDVGKWAEDKVREHQQVVKAAMQMEQNTTARKASAVERELRRQRSALTGDRKGQMRGL